MNRPYKIVYVSDVCMECSAARQEAERKAMYEYTDAVVYIRKVTNDKDVFEGIFGSASSSQGDPQLPSLYEGGSEKDPDFSQVRRVQQIL